VTPKEQLTYFFANNKFLEALEFAQSILAREPDDELAIEAQGLSFLYLGRSSEALEIYRRLVQSPNASPAVVQSYIYAVARNGYFEEAFDIGNRILSVVDDQGIRTLLATLNSGPNLPNLQGSHAPERQIYMSSVVGMLDSGDHPIRILEIGSFMGGSMLTWANAIAHLSDRAGHITCVDPWHEEEESAYDPASGGAIANGIAYRLFLNSKRFVSPRVHVEERPGTSQMVLPGLNRSSFDIVYIDGSHLYADVKYDIEQARSLVCDGGFICGDDLEIQMQDLDRTFCLKNAEVDYIADPLTGRDYHPGVSLAVSDVFGPVSVYRGFWIMQKKQGSFGPVTLKGFGLLPQHWPLEFQHRAAEIVQADGYLKIKDISTTE
jgi:tetratricopeptide (TPR) repeat protein